MENTGNKSQTSLNQDIWHQHLLLLKKLNQLGLQLLASKENNVILWNQFNKNLNLFSDSKEKLSHQKAPSQKISQELISQFTQFTNLMESLKTQIKEGQNDIQNILTKLKSEKKNHLPLSKDQTHYIKTKA